METKIDNRALHGTSDSGQVVKEAIYKVKRPNANTYDRIHFETSSNMVYDATKENIADKIVRRGTRGEIKVGSVEADAMNIKNLEAETLNAKTVNSDIVNTEDVKTNSINLFGKAGITYNTTNNSIEFNFI